MSGRGDPVSRQITLPKTCVFCKRAPGEIEVNRNIRGTEVTGWFCNKCLGKRLGKCLKKALDE
jgi:hypothetical protein